ncbi:MAG: hypothetical protein DI551_09175 [Micavibrio aeruginosavorus]|uniref:Uncharacterized protein n=1 Tax=Micavibrio aeruginosavorus TaxID=349221 RepID=A0A2W5PJZ1_9BACT|nr:MAG: hypothetical protein DI551_09175 [Micavibrio aeruginosavorus]
MSFEKAIGFGINPDDPKGPLLPLTKAEKKFLSDLGIVPKFIDLKDMLPAECKEPEPKILVTGPKCFMNIRAFFSSAENSALIPGQMYTGKLPLTSVLLDTVENGSPTAKLSQSDMSLRYRFEMDVATRKRNKGDYNEKSAMKTAEVIGGIADRDEKECELKDGDSLRDGYQRFLSKYRKMNDPAFCDDVIYDDLHVLGGYIAARTEYGFAVRHPKYPVAFVFEACEDMFDTLKNNLSESLVSRFEFEFEPKQMWGDANRLPLHARTKEGFKEFLYNFMCDIRDDIHLATPGSLINVKSKAEVAREDLIAFECNSDDFKRSGLADYFGGATNASGECNELAAAKWALVTSQPLKETLKTAGHAIFQRCAKLHKTKIFFNEAAEGLDAIPATPGLRVIPSATTISARAYAH